MDKPKIELLIMGEYEANQFEPKIPTYAIRIFSSFLLDWQRGPLKHHDKFKHVFAYEFDDNDNSYQAGDVTLTRGLAKRIVHDFSLNRNGIECLLVHCSQGKNRSPAVAIAFNEFFCLGYDTEALKEKYGTKDAFIRGYNKFVYKLILDAAYNRH